MASGVLDASSLADALVSCLQKGASESLLDGWAEARREKFLKAIDPISKGCFWAVQDPDVDSLPQRHPLIKAMKAGKPPSMGTDVTMLPGYAQ